MDAYITKGFSEDPLTTSKGGLGGGTLGCVSEASGTDQTSEDSSVPVSPIGWGQTPTVKPWSCARAKFVVRPPNRDMKSKARRRKLQEDKDAWENILPRTPYVKVKWKYESIEEEMTGLVDTGADWSLMVESQLSDSERQELMPSEVKGQGVTKEKISVLGEVWRDLIVGGIEIPKQRFIVVEDMITPVILGADFWMRLGELTIDFKSRKIKVNSLGVQLDMLQSPGGDAESGGQVLVLTEKEVHIPPFSEMLVRAKVTGRKLPDNEEIFIEPVSEDGNLCSIPYTLGKVKDGTVMLKVANVGMDDIIMQ